MRRRCWIVPLLVCCVLISPAAAKNERKGKSGGKVNYSKLMLSDKFMPVAREHLALQDVEFAPGAPAVVLLEGKQHDFKRVVTEVTETTTIYVRRVKILKDSGIERYGKYRATFSSGTRIEKVLARTILPDGTVVDAADHVTRDESETGRKIVSIAFPQVSKGAIVDVLTLTHRKDFFTMSWKVQERIPVLDSRFVVAPPSDLQFTSSTRHLSPEESTAGQVQSTRGRAFVWNFRDVEPVPDEPNQPPMEDCAKTLYIIPTALHGRGYHIDFASTWDRWAKGEDEWWNDWLSTKRSARDLAAEVTAGLQGPVEKAEAIRKALRERVEVDGYWDIPRNSSPDDTLAEGSGWSADLAGTAVAMLRSVDVDAHLVAFRHRDDGVIPSDFPMPILLNDLAIRIRTPEGDLYFSPIAECPVTILPAYCRGVYAAVIDKTTTGPIQLPDFTAGENRVVRMAKAQLDEMGNLTGESQGTYRGIQAEYWRNRLRPLAEDKRIAAVQEAHRTWMPGAVLDSLEIENMDEDSESLVMKCTFRMDGYAASAGKRLIVNPNLLGRISTEDWAAERRVTTIDLGGAFETSDTVTLKLPKGFTGAELPTGANFSGGNALSYKMSYTLRGSMLVAKRYLRVNQYQYAAGGWPNVKRMFLDIANQDDQPVVVAMQ